MLAYLSSLFAVRARDDRGATAVEYGLMVAFIAMAIIGMVYLLGGNLVGPFSDLAAEIVDRDG